MSKSSEWNILRLLKWSTTYFQSHDIESARATAEILLSHILNMERIALYVHYDKPLTQKELFEYKKLIKRRVKREPVAYIVGKKEFWSIDLDVSEAVLIPRPDTECLVEKVLALLAQYPDGKPQSILEMGTGSGAICIAVASEKPQHVYYALDCSEKALTIAKQNAKKNGLGDTIQLFCSQWFESIKGSHVQFEMIISNPPYIKRNTIKTLQPEVSIYEPSLALDGGDDGLDDIRYIICNATKYLNPQGYLLLEFGYDQKAAIKNIIEATELYESVAFFKDYGGNDRVVQMKKKI